MEGKQTTKIKSKQSHPITFHMVNTTIVLRPNYKI